MIRPAGALAASILLLSACSGGSDEFLANVPAITTLDVQTQVFTPRCAISGCHVGSGAPFGLDLSGVAATRASAVGIASNEMPSLQRIDPFDAESSYLYLKVTGDPSILGDPMPASGGPLNAADIALIQAWIDTGAN